ncbi:hypothetical protein BO83DRAFT_427843 [Aspergillus eucalypticola CBS 122712]|uniref:Uncharacterized protein n=1 Tax=Aspergillus eucalypticola (strain CBS 122712 / IBT 29274) TaxID=1448314 RepID=A0A317VAI8_ASPEC|nr:uncharacterized protein BO83DRAFT_427843 [Aspergillus eucalypticola CBS 122712]PWY71226.1 hypothetical protein BO83DRAFT_427843 [Aspergillus eucalypticola CBS 122712]
MAKIFQAFEARGIMRNTCVYSLSCAIDFFVYGGAYGGVWSMQDTQFLYDYAIGSRPQGDAELEAIRNRFQDGKRRGCSQRRDMLYGTTSNPLCAFRCTDGVFANGLYDSRGDDTTVLILCALVAMHDFTDLGYDMASGEIGDIVPSLCKGDLRPESLKRAYARLGALYDLVYGEPQVRTGDFDYSGDLHMANVKRSSSCYGNAVAVPENLRFRVGWKFKGTLPGYSDLMDDSRYTQHTPERFDISIPWSGEVVSGGHAVSRVVGLTTRPEEQEALEMFSIKYLTEADQPDFHVYNPAALRLMCDDDCQRKIDFTWALCVAMWEEGIL